MKIVELILGDDELTGIEAISVVENPAIEEDFIALKSEEIKLAEVDKEKRILMGALLVPNKPIYRRKGEEEYYIYFSKDTVEKASQLYLMKGNQSKATLEHQHTINGLTLVESWLVEDEVHDKSRKYGLNVPVGTWMGAVKVNNDEIWNSVKEGKVRGFSIEGFFTDRVIEASRPKDIIDLAEKCTDCPDEVTLGKIRDIILENELSVVGTLDGEPLFATKEEAKIYAEMFKGCTGFHTHRVNGVVRYMACETHEDSTKVEYTENELGKKRKKYKKKYKYVEYADFVNNQALAKYSWEQCIRDMVKQYGNKKVANKVCSSIKNRTVNR